jgi:hypothetical protein
LTRRMFPTIRCCNISSTGSFWGRMLKARDRARVGRACVFDVAGKALKVRGAAIGMTPPVTVTPRLEQEFRADFDFMNQGNGSHINNYGGGRCSLMDIASQAGYRTSTIQTMGA